MKLKLKLVAVAAFAVCGSSAFAACPSSGADAITLATECVPEYTVYAAGASAQKPAIDNLMMVSGTVFDNDKAIAYIVPTNDKHTTPAASYSSTDGKTVKSGIKNTVIYYGTGALNTAFSGKRVAFVYNTANGSFAGVKQMTAKLPTDALFKETDSFIVRRSATDTAIPTCVTVTVAQSEQVVAAGGSKIKAASVLFPGAPAKAATVACAIDATVNGFNYTTSTAIPGGVAGVQLALADVNPVHASPDVALAVGAPLKASNFQIVPTAVQGFGVVVNNLALKALIKNQKARGMLPSSCDETTLTTTNVTGECQPTVSRVLMTAIVGGTAKPSMISGDAADDASATAATPGKKIRLERRTNWSGTQAASNLMFAGYGATEGRKIADLADAAKFAKLGVTGVVNTWDMTGASADSVGNLTKLAATDGFVDMVYNVSGTDVMNHVAEDATNYSFGVVSLEKVQKNDDTATSGLKSSNGNFWAGWVKIDGISPNFTGLTGAYDPKQRTSMANGYPMAYEMVAIKNTALMKKGATQLMQKAVVDKVVDGLKNSSYNLAGLAYFSITAGDTDTLSTAIPPTSKKAVFTRGGNAANFAPLVANKQ